MSKAFILTHNLTRMLDKAVTKSKLPNLNVAAELQILLMSFESPLSGFFWCHFAPRFGIPAAWHGPF
jgi:hypothetical protein